MPVLSHPASLAGCESPCCQYRGESLAIGDGDSDGGMAHNAGGLDTGNRFAEADTETACTVGGHGQPSVGKGQMCRARGLEEAERPGDGGGGHIGEGCSYSPGSKSDGKLTVAYVDRRSVRGDTERQAGDPVKGGEPEREGLRRHGYRLPDDVSSNPSWQAVFCGPNSSIEWVHRAGLRCRMVKRSSGCGSTPDGTSTRSWIFSDDRVAARIGTPVSDARTSSGNRCPHRR